MIELKRKACKGQGMAKGHGCGKLTYHRKYGLGKGCCYPDWLLNTDAGKLKLKQSILKASKPRLELEQARNTRKEHNSLKSLLTNVTIQLHRYIRKRDTHKPCISCNVQWNDTFQAGHFYKAELYSNLKFDKYNIHGQCVRCNNFLEGNEGGYRVGLINRYGKDFLDSLDAKAQDYKKSDFKWDVEELKRIKKEVQSLNKKL
jgi:hypothetical protein